MKIEERSLEDQEEELRSRLILIKSKENLLLAIVAGLFSSLIGASIWATITIITEYRIFWMAMGVGALVGVSVRILGKGTNALHGVVGAVFSLLGCALGNFLSIAGFLAIEESVSVFEILKTLDYTLVPQIMVETFSWLDPAYYFVALIMGYKISFEQFSLYEQSILNDYKN